MSGGSSKYARVVLHGRDDITEFLLDTWDLAVVLFWERMSESEQDAIIGRTLREYRDAKKELAALRAQMESIGGRLQDVGRQLREQHSFSDLHTTGGSLIQLPTREELMELSSQIKRATEMRERLARLLGEAGFLPKD